MYFKRSPRLHIELPDFPTPYEKMSRSQQEDVLVEWERIKAQIPDQVKRFETDIQSLLDHIHEEDNWDVVTDCFQQISDYASRINELNLWARVDPHLHTHSHANAHTDATDQAL